MVVTWLCPGVGGLSANAAARLFLEYPPAIRDQLLDLMFLPSGGAAWQLLKVEIGGDVESSCEPWHCLKHPTPTPRYSLLELCRSLCRRVFPFPSPTSMYLPAAVQCATLTLYLPSRFLGHSYPFSSPPPRPPFPNAHPALLPFSCLLDNRRLHNLFCTCARRGTVVF